MRLFRHARSESARVLLAATALQSAVVWGVALVIVPGLIVRMERTLGWDPMSFPWDGSISLVLCVVCTGLNVWTGATLALSGRGTPLPLACPRELVTTGPYRYVRNPMAVAGIGQGVAVGLWLGSATVILYAIAGALVWHVGVRPAEERDLMERFGASYAAYRERVPLWWPIRLLRSGRV